MIFFIQIENNFFLGFCPYHEKKLEILLKCHVYIKIILILYCSLISQKETDITWASHGPYCFAHFPLNINNTNRQLAEVARPATNTIISTLHMVGVHSALPIGVALSQGF
jgi:hypothetical protein